MSTPEPTLRERILVVATRRFAARGYAAVSMRELAEALEVSKPALYYHFADKESLLAAILTWSVERLGEITSAALRETSAEARLRYLVETLIALPPEQRAVLRLSGQESANLGPDARAQFLAQYRERFIGPLMRIFGEGLAAGELRGGTADVLTWIFLGMLYPFVSEGGPASVVPPETASRAVLDIFLQGANAAP